MTDETTLERGTVQQRLEAILMIADEPIGLVSLSAAVGAPVPAVRQALESLVADYDGADGGTPRGFELREVGGGWRMYVRADFDDLVADYIGGQAPAKLSQAALETLAVIAYKQPVTRSQVAAIRAVNVDSVVRTLLARGLITEQFADPETGAINYGTTGLLMQQLGINSLDELPPDLPPPRRRRRRLRRLRLSRLRFFISGTSPVVCPPGEVPE